MKPLFAEEEYVAAKFRDKLPLACEHCLVSFLRTKRQIYQVRNTLGRNVCDFCSNTCRSKHKGLIHNVSCETCQNVFFKTTAELNKTLHNFCTRSCAAKYNNAHKTTGIRRSKFEIFIEEILCKAYPNISIHFNKRSAIEMELDIYIPNLKLAIEINGVHHYKSIYGQDKHEVIQCCDMRKKQLCYDAGIQLVVIDISGLINFSTLKAMVYWPEIKSAIDNKIINQAV